MKSWGMFGEDDQLTDDGLPNDDGLALVRLESLYLELCQVWRVPINHVSKRRYFFYWIIAQRYLLAWTCWLLLSVSTIFPVYDTPSDVTGRGFSCLEKPGASIPFFREASCPSHMLEHTLHGFRSQLRQDLFRRLASSCCWRMNWQCACFSVGWYLPGTECLLG